MADSVLAVRISAQTDEFVKSVEDAKTKVRSLAMQMAEIDKQLKTESADRVQKLGEKLELAKRAANMAAEEANKYGEKIAQLTAKHEDASKMTDRQKEQVLKLSEQMATAQQKANTYAAEVDKLQKEFEEAESSSKNLENATNSLSDSLDDTTDSTDNLADSSQKSAGMIDSFLSRLKNISVTDITKKALSGIAGLFKDIAARALDAAKAVVDFAQTYAKEAINMAADYQDALGYSEQVFNDHAEAVQKWVKENSVRLRLNVSDLQTYVNNMGSLYRSFGFEAQQAAEYAQGLVDRAADLKAATGKELTDVLNSLTSVMTGGYRAGYQYGIVINEAAISAYALSNNIAQVEVNQNKVTEASIKVEKATKKVSEAALKYGEDSLEAREAQIALEKASADLEEALGGQTIALTQAQREEAIYGMILEQTNHIKGQSVRESEGYKSQLDALKTTFDNLKISIGDKLLPVVTDLIKAANDFFQSTEGQELLDSIVTSVGKLGEKIREMIEDGRFEEWLQNIKEKVPDIVDGIGNFTDKVIELAPKIEALIDKLMESFGLQTEAEKAKEAYMKVSNQVEDMAKTFDISLDTAKKAVNEFAETNGIKVSEVYQNWAEYEPQIVAFMGGISGGAEDMETKYNEHLSELAPDLQKAVNDVSAVDLSPYDQHLAKMNQSAQENLNGIINAWESVKNTAMDVWSGITNLFNGDLWENSNFDLSGGTPHAAGGPAKAGHLYQVNDDHGRRKEMFVPYVDGYILNGNDTQRVINNSTNNSRTYGDMHIYVNSYGTDAASIVDEIGAELNRRLRMSGA